MVCGSRDRTARIWILSSNCPGGTIPMNDKVWSVAISSTQRCELLCCLGSEFQWDAGVLDIVYESPFQQLTCGYDTYIRSWDLRLSPRKCVMEWEEPHDSALYCIQTDGNHMIASGSSYYGVIRTWDKRQTRCLEMFQLSSAVSSPVYCLRFNTSHLYAALATALHSLDFKQGPRPRR
nr:F-box/WD repeat-containing protein 4-like [Salvelinus alpinus]